MFATPILLVQRKVRGGEISVCKYCSIVKILRGMVSGVPPVARAFIRSNDDTDANSHATVGGDVTFCSEAPSLEKLCTPLEN